MRLAQLLSPVLLDPLVHRVLVDEVELLARLVKEYRILQETNYVHLQCYVTFALLFA